MKKSALFLFSLLATSCVHMRSISTTSIPVERDNTVETQAYRFLFLLINFDNNYIDQMTRDLAKQCPDGRVEGILTKHEDIMYFPLFAHAVRVTATGYCVNPKAQPPQQEPETSLSNPAEAGQSATETSNSATAEPTATEASPEEATK